jgi:uncharacterized protein YecE (DUF72 family)
MNATQGMLFQPPRRNSTLRVGPAGWNYKDWEGFVYPAAGGKSFDPLSYLADYCDTIEINSSFYAPPKSGTAAVWARKVRNNPNFRFTAKAWQRLSHDACEDAANALPASCNTVRASMEPLAEAGVLGALLIQFPWKFRYAPENLEHLKNLFRYLKDFPLVLEVRHGSWDRKPFYDFLREHGVAFCNIDQPVIGNSLKPGAALTSSLGYFRFHGRNYANWFKEGAGRDARYDYLYTKEEIRELSARIRSVQPVATETYVVTNNHFRGQALVNAMEILEEMDAAPPTVPPLLEAAYPHRFPGSSPGDASKV